MARGEANRIELEQRAADERERYMMDAAAHDVSARVAEVAQRLQRVSLSLAGRLEDRLRDQDLFAVQEAARHYQRLAEIVNRRLHRGGR